MANTVTHMGTVAYVSHRKYMDMEVWIEQSNTQKKFVTQ